MVYRYSLLRFVPDPAKGEFVNLGLIARDDENQDWDLRIISNLRRAKALDHQGLLPAALEFIGHLEENVSAVDQLFGPEGEPISNALLSRLAVEMQNVVQITPPAPVVAGSASAAIDLLFEQLLVDPLSRRFPFEKKFRALKRTREAYRALALPRESIDERVIVSSGPFATRFDFGVHNGHVLQLVQCWSFQLPNQEELAEEVKAWAWIVHRLRERGGECFVPHARLEIPPHTAVSAVYIRPRGEDPAPAYEEALAAFRETRVTAVEPEEVEAVAEHAATLLRAT
jgi:Protein of unknown function (DUF3037)